MRSRSVVPPQSAHLVVLQGELQAGGSTVQRRQASSAHAAGFVAALAKKRSVGSSVQAPSAIHAGRRSKVASRSIFAVVAGLHEHHGLEDGIEECHAVALSHCEGDRGVVEADLVVAPAMVKPMNGGLPATSLDSAA